ncbi:UNVERIFIED_CONTAM: hypothetical protein NY603_38965, partial [Bacteroidetes bacterium 56_B9]
PAAPRPAGPRAGPPPRMPPGLCQGLRPKTSHIVSAMGYAADLHPEALIATRDVLFVFIILNNLSYSIVKGGNDYS